MNYIKKFIYLSAFFCAATLSAADFAAKSPNGKLTAEINLRIKTLLSIKLGDEYLLKDAQIGLSTNLGDILKNPKFISEKTDIVNNTIKPVWWTRSEIKDIYNETTLEFQHCYLILRLYDDAVAYRIKLKGNDFATIFDEILTLPFDNSARVYAHPYDPSCESNYKKTTVGEIKNIKKGINTSLIVQTPGAKIFFTESDIIEYPSMRLKYSDTQDGVLSAEFSKMPKTLKKVRIFLKPDELESFIARRPAAQPLPWRVFVVAQTDRELLDNDTVYKLARESKIADTSWIKTGVCQWEWWNDTNLEGVDFKTGINTRTYDFYADFSAKNKLPFLLIDAGWVEDYFQCADAEPTFDIAEVISRANKGGVNVIVWLTAASVNDEQYARSTLARLKKWGAAGVKVDFMNRDDAQAMAFFEKFASIAAEYKMLVDYHGCPKPAGLSRTYPNVVNFEAVRGAEMSKFDTTITPRHNVEIAFARMPAGPMDYTPGATRNAGVSAGKFKGKNILPISFSRPIAQGTRANQAAMYIMYFEPLKMLSDSPTQYMKNMEFFDFIKSVPTTWDDTVSIDGIMSEYAAIARRKGDDWYIAAMTNESARELQIPLNFLKEGALYEAEIITDTVNTDKNPTESKTVRKTLRRGDTINADMQMGGGLAAKLVKKN